MKKDRTPKIVDVARVANVSTATVSRALSKPETVAKSTREAVLRAAAQTGYRINFAARNLRSKRTGIIVVLVPNLGNSFFSEILVGLENTLSENGLSILMVDTRHPSSDPQFIFDYLDDSRADGIVALDGSLSSQMLQKSLERSENLQIVFACEWHKSGNYPSVQTDNRQGCRLAIDHLAQLGHTKIGYINGRPDNVLTASRRDDTHEALSDLGLNCVDEWFFDGNFSMEGGVRAAHQFLNLQNRPTAMFCANDETAFGLISELNKHGVSVPDDLSVVGFDDIDISRYFIPALTTIRQPRIELGARAAEMIINRIQSGGQTCSLPQETLPVELVVRNSTAPV